MASATAPFRSKGGRYISQTCTDLGSNPGSVAGQLLDFKWQLSPWTVVVLKIPIPSTLDAQHGWQAVGQCPLEASGTALQFIASAL